MDTSVDRARVGLTGAKTRHGQSRFKNDHEDLGLGIELLL